MGYDNPWSRFAGRCALAGTAALALVALIALAVAAAGTAPYSTGHRDGYVQKVSLKGTFPNLRKSWEGELALPNQNGPDSVFKFSVEDHSGDVIAALDDRGTCRGDRMVRVWYKQWLFFRPWMYDSGYRVVRVEPLDDSAQRK